MENDMWQTASPLEYEAAKQIAERLLRQNRSPAEYAALLLRIEQYTDAYRAVLEMPSSSPDGCISNNIVAQVAYFLSEGLRLNDGNGVVFTANILAEDMVRMSMIEWIHANLQISRSTAADYVYQRERIAAEEERKMKSALSALRWYDPCVGGGAFPMAILSVYKEMGLPGIPYIFGNDRNPLYAAATEKRMELTANAAGHIVCRDALEIVFAPEERYDIVIGNPPYVKAGKLDKETKKICERHYPDISSRGADLYTYFISHGLNALKDGGVLTYVTPAQFQISDYGRSIRTVMERQGDICAVADFNELPVFRDMGVHTSVYAFVKAKMGKNFLRHEYDALPESTPLAYLYERGVEIPQRNISAKGWFFGAENAYEVLEYLENAGMPLVQYAQQVFSGIKSGCKAAFFVKEKDVSGFEARDLCKCRKMLPPQKIRRWKSTWDGDLMIVVKKGERLAEDSGLYAYLARYREKLAGRYDAAGHKTWYGLRACAYYEKFEGPKIIYPDIATECRFSMDLNAHYIPDGAFFIPGENYYLLGLLNSCVGRYYFRQKCARIGNPMKGGRIRFKKVYVEKFPVVSESENRALAEKISQLAMCAAKTGFLTPEQERKLDEYAVKMYKIPEEMKHSVMEA